MKWSLDLGVEFVDLSAELKDDDKSEDSVVKTFGVNRDNGEKDEEQPL